ncbi:MAG: class I SAM-dependent methyltransferase [Chitinophagaceae bacterium]|nr:MAG: class I SAM-dependent methyltransferase [Chitinophagaceae bacterium]
MEKNFEMNTTSVWFKDWFDSPYYHLLYKHRDEKEAGYFLENLLTYLNPKKDTYFVDMACGNGRHAHFISEKNYRITGLDLSANNIKIAKAETKSDRADFLIHDMRDPFPVKNVDVILNLFTSYGYFENEEVHLNILKNVHDALSENGTFLLDFLNIHLLEKNLVSEEEKIIEDVHFHIQRKIENQWITKTIHFEVDGKPRHFQENVYGFTKKELLNLFEKAGFKILDLFGDYSLNPFEKVTSPRLIITATK